MADTEFQIRYHSYPRAPLEWVLTTCLLPDRIRISRNRTRGNHVDDLIDPTCPWCDVAFDGPIALAEHIPLHCIVCAQLFQDFDSVVYHFGDTHARRDYTPYVPRRVIQCKYCDSRFLYEEYAMAHGIAHCSYPGMDCGMLFTSAEDKERHVSDKHPSSLEIWKHADEGQCMICDMSVPHKYPLDYGALTEHYASHCLRCDERLFLSREEAERHRDAQHNPMHDWERCMDLIIFQTYLLRNRNTVA